jgi:glucose-6-phosphate isomerase
MKFRYKTSQIDDSELTTIGELLKDYIKHLHKVAKDDGYNFDESSINLPFDTDLVKEARSLKDKMVDDRLKYVVDIGIGGSNLGTRAIYDALYGYFDVIEPDRFPKIVFVDTNDANYIHKLMEFLKTLKPYEVLINVISKSGDTTETIANLEMLLATKKGFKERLVVTTSYKSDLWNIAKDEEIPSLPIPDKVGGRYSVFSAVGVFPLVCINANVFKLMEGAMSVRERCVDADILKNPALLSAIILYLNYRRGNKINDTFLFHPELESLGKWYRQLIAESVGKDGVGITPTVSIGSTDLHSMGQLYLGGPKDKFFTFVSATHRANRAKVPVRTPFPLKVEEIRGKTAQQIMDAIYSGVKITYEKADIPFVEIALEDVTEASLGKFMQFKMIEMMYLGRLLEVNAFDQPNVESYKTETKEILAKMPNED